MTALPPDPDPDRTPGLQPGGGVRPGDTPPESGSTTEGLSRRERCPSRTMAVVTTIFVVLVTIAIVALVIAQLTGIAKVL
ncbi:DUF6480 family protein [Actinokineospora xionganensis]|uniref:Uncharacterized protein n=1 Tax=Actinokineospora xionganensis TaxID=2684470 RepID=A0ABR7LES3_9PSEU|nr:DUF6480 family protein [Actinokineospora xionganensis]MBC6451216.1 hypothetical protein [Actinokineospora xionganensis]